MAKCFFCELPEERVEISSDTRVNRIINSSNKTTTVENLDKVIHTSSIEAYVEFRRMSFAIFKECWKCNLELRAVNNLSIHNQK